MNPEDQSNSFNQMAQTTFSAGQYWTVLGFTVAGLLCLLAFVAFALRQRRHLDPRFRLAINAGTTLALVASISYALIIYKLLVGYALIGGSYVPQASALLAVPARYLDWTITVPLLVVELIGVSTLSLTRATWLRLVGVVSGFLMILCGYLGEVASSAGDDLGGRVGWGVVSSGFFVVLLVIVIYTVRESVLEFSAAEQRAYRSAAVLLIAVWFIYPIMYGINGFVHGGQWVLATQVAYCIADVLAKVGFGLLLLRVMRLRSERSRPSTSR